MAQSRDIVWIVALAATAGCASIVTETSAEAGRTDVPSFEASVVDGAATDAPGIDASMDALRPADVVLFDASAPDARADVPATEVTCPPIVDVDVPVDVPADGPYVVELAVAGQLHQCARMSDGTVRCRGGFNAHGEVGIGTFGMEVPNPVTVPGLSGVAQVVTNNTDVTCTRHDDGTVRCWGSNHYGLVGVGHDGDETCSDDEPCRPSPTQVPGLDDVTFLAASDFVVCAVRRDGSVWCWGDLVSLMPSGSSATPVRVTTFTDVAEMWSVNFGWVARLRSGGYASVGPWAPGTASLPIPTGAVIDSWASDEPGHLCYRMPGGATQCIGQNDLGQLGNGTSTSGYAFSTDPSTPLPCGARSVVVGTYDTCALMGDRTVQCWGDGQYGALGSDPPDTCAGSEVFSNDRCATRPAVVPGLDGVERLYLGVWGACALRLDHGVWCWGGTLGTQVPMPVAW